MPMPHPLNQAVIAQALHDLRTGQLRRCKSMGFDEHDLAALKLRKDMINMRADLRKDILAMRKDLLKDMDTFNAQIQTKFSQHDNKLLVRLGMIFSFVAGIMVAVLRYL